MTNQNQKPSSGKTEIDGTTLDGAELLNQVRAALARYVILPDDPSMVGVVLWIAASHAVPGWGHAPRLVIRAPMPRCGKSRLLDLIEALCHRPLITVNASPSAVYRSIGLAQNDPPTVLLDEADTVFGPKAGDNEDLRGLLNAGHQRNRPTTRYNAATQNVEQIETFAMAALAGIGKMPDTIEDRAVVIRMRRRAPGETVAPYRVRRDGPALADLRARLHAWVRAHLDQLTTAEPTLPVEDRAADTWEPLVAIADLADAHRSDVSGLTWSDLARHAATVLTESKEADGDLTPQLRLLTDCRTAFVDADALPTVSLLERLNSDPEAPWASWRPNGLTANKLSGLLREFDIRPDTIRFATGQAKGYYRDRFKDAWSRYCPHLADQQRQGEPYQPYQPYPADVSAGQEALLPGTAREKEPYQSRTTNPRAVPAVPEPYHAEPVSDLHKQQIGTAGTAGTAPPTPTRPATATCIVCRLPMTYDNGTHTHPTCETEENAR